MKVNVTGKGLIPSLGVLAPMYRVDMTEKEVVRLLNFKNFKVYDSSTGGLITKKNLSTVLASYETDDIVEEANIETTIEEEVGVIEQVAEPIIMTEELISEETTDDTVEEVMVETTIEEEEEVTDTVEEITSELIEDVIDEIVVDEITTDSVSVDETIEEVIETNEDGFVYEKPKYNNNKSRNKNKNKRK